MSAAPGLAQVHHAAADLEYRATVEFVALGPLQAAGATADAPLHRSPANSQICTDGPTPATVVSSQQPWRSGASLPGYW